MRRLDAVHAMKARLESFVAHGITCCSIYNFVLTSLQPRPGNWHRNQNRTTLGDTTNVTAPPKPPVPATSQAKSKLKAFQFVAGQPNAARENTESKENGSATGSSRPVDRIIKLHDATSSSAPHNPTKTASAMNEADSTKTPQLCHANTFPSTPGARLSLEDLIGNVDDTKIPEPREESPEDHIGWIPNSSSTQLTPNRKRKRARSSSPSCPNTSSQRAEASAFFAGGAEQQTPEADPAADLWQRYGISKGSGDALKQPDVNSLAFGGSPRPLETPVKASGLRRWASTGNDWPSSKSKKRRSNANMKVDVWQNGTAGSGGRSKVAAMVEKIQESLATQKLAKSAQALVGDEPPSSDPLPDTASKTTKPQLVASPLESKPNANNPQSNVNRRMAPPSARPHTGTRAQTLAVDGPDNNKKDETMRIVNAFSGQENVAPAPLHLQSKAPLPAFRRPSIRRTPSDNGPIQKSMPAPSVAPVHAHLPVLTEDLDEFGDDMDFSTEDLDELLSQPLQKRSLHDIPAHPNPPPQQQQQQKPQQQQPPPPQQQLTAQQSIANELIDLADDDFDDDEFACDDLDETSFIQAELQATQAYRASRPSSK
jgi:DNA replication ATP-dependent helicase Dna2